MQWDNEAQEQNWWHMKLTLFSFEEELVIQKVLQDLSDMLLCVGLLIWREDEEVIQVNKDILVKRFAKHIIH